MALNVGSWGWDTENATSNKDEFCQLQSKSYLL